MIRTFLCLASLTPFLCTRELVEKERSAKKFQTGDGTFSDPPTIGALVVSSQSKEYIFFKSIDMIKQSTNQLPHLWTTLSLALLAASAFILIFSGSKNGFLDEANAKYLRYEKVLCDVWDEGLGSMGPALTIEQEKLLIMLTTSTLVLVVAALDFFMNEHHEFMFVAN